MSSAAVMIGALRANNGTTRSEQTVQSFPSSSAALFYDEVGGRGGGGEVNTPISGQGG